MILSGYETFEIIRRELGRRVKSARIALSVTQRQFAKNCGISTHTLSNAENGKDVGFTVLLAILRELSMLPNVEDLIPDVTLRPYEAARHDRKRERARKRKEKNPSEWKWGDEE